jgi:uncharacterized protein (TIGR02391 family)
MTKTKNKPTLNFSLKELWSEGFFKDAKSLTDISGEFAVRGYHFRSSTLSTALTRIVQSKGFITRIKEAGKWRYIQRHPTNSQSGQRTELFEKYELHSRIKGVAFNRFQDGYFKESIQNALVEVIDQVKVKAGHPKNNRGHELDGDDLMNRVFGCDNQEPVIKFNELHTSLDKAEQRGIMYLFKGVVGIRDKKAHLNFVQNDPLKTFEYLSLASLLMRLLDET